MMIHVLAVHTSSVTSDRIESYRYGYTLMVMLGVLSPCWLARESCSPSLMYRKSGDKKFKNENYEKSSVDNGAASPFLFLLYLNENWVNCTDYFFNR